MEMLVRVVDKQKTGNVYNDRHLSEKGCVICIMPDGHTWSEREKTNPEWQIIKFPGVAEKNVTHFIEPEFGYGKYDYEIANRVIRRWQYKFDVDLYNNLVKRPLIKNKFDHDPVVALNTILNTLRVKLSSLIDPSIFGLVKNSKVFG